MDLGDLAVDTRTNDDARHRPHRPHRGEGHRHRLDLDHPRADRHGAGMRRLGGSILRAVADAPDLVGVAAPRQHQSGGQDGHHRARTATDGPGRGPDVPGRSANRAAHGAPPAPALHSSCRGGDTTPGNGNHEQRAPCGARSEKRAVSRRRPCSPSCASGLELAKPRRASWRRNERGGGRRRTGTTCSTAGGFCADGDSAHPSPSVTAQRAELREDNAVVDVDAGDITLIPASLNPPMRPSIAGRSRTPHDESRRRERH